MTSASNPEVVLLFRLRDEISSQLAVVNQRLDATERAGNRANQSFRRNNDTLANTSRTLLLFGATLLTTAAAVARLGVNLGLLDEEQEKQLTKWISIIGAVSAVAGGIGRMIPQVLRLTEDLKLMNLQFTGILAIAGAFLAVAAAVTVATVAFNKLDRSASPESNLRNLNWMNAALGPIGGLIGGAKLAFSHQMGTGQEQRIPGPTTQGVLAMVHGGETISRGSSSGGGSATTVNLTGPFMGNESEARNFARKIGRYLQEERRIGGLTI